MAQINIKKNDAAYVSTPPSGIQTIFVADNGDLYTMDSSGTATLIGGGGSGSSGSSGSSGTSGTSGVDGSSGSSGVNGSSGSSGVNGSSGSSGVNGSSGSSGIDGTSSSQTLEQTLTLGNTTGANDIIFGTANGLLFNNTSRLREGTIDAGYGGNKGIAQICAVGYEMKWESGSLYIMNGDGTQIREVRYTFGATPSTSDDVTKGFTIDSRWVLDNGDLYTCSDNATSSAVWSLSGGGTSYTYITEDTLTGTLYINTPGQARLVTSDGIETSMVQTSTLGVRIDDNNQLGDNNRSTALDVGHSGDNSVITMWMNDVYGNSSMELTSNHLITTVTDGTSSLSITADLTGISTNSTNGDGQQAYININSDISDPRIYIQAQGGISGNAAIDVRGTYVSLDIDNGPIKLTSNTGIEINSSIGGTSGYIIPVNDGTSGDVLTTDGAGVASWVAPSGGGGGEAGLVAGPGTNSVQSNTTLTPGASASSGNSIAIGNDVIISIGSTNSTSLGYDNLVPEDSTDSLVLGSGNLKTVDGAIKLKKSVVLGYGNYINNSNASPVSGVVLIGQNNRFNTAFSANEGDGSVLIGKDNQITSGNSQQNVVIGSGNTVNRFRNVAVGDGLNISGGAIGSIAIGAGPGVSGELGIAMGYNNSASGYSLGLGYGGNTNGNTTVGLFGAASGNNSFAASGGSVNATGAMAVGSGAVSTHNYAYVFGHSLSSQFIDTTHVDRLSIKNVDVYADNAAAITGGLTASQVYRTSTGVLMIVF